jgi:hypothetical protein
MDALVLGTRSGVQRPSHGRCAPGLRRNDSEIHLCAASTLAHPRSAELARAIPILALERRLPMYRIYVRIALAVEVLRLAGRGQRAAVVVCGMLSAITVVRCALVQPTLVERHK